MRNCFLAEILKTFVAKETENKASESLERVFSNLVETIVPSSVDGFRFLVTFIGEYNSHACVKIMRTKNQVYQKLKEYLANYGTPSTRRSENGREYTEKRSINFVPTIKSKRNKHFTRLLNKMVSPRDTRVLWLKQLGVV